MANMTTNIKVSFNIVSGEAMNTIKLPINLDGYLGGKRLLYQPISMLAKPLTQFEVVETEAYCGVSLAENQVLFREDVFGHELLKVLTLREIVKDPFRGCQVLWTDLKPEEYGRFELVNSESGQIGKVSPRGAFPNLGMFLGNYFGVTCTLNHRTAFVVENESAFIMLRFVKRGLR